MREGERENSIRKAMSSWRKQSPIDQGGDSSDNAKERKKIDDRFRFMMLTQILP